MAINSDFTIDYSGKTITHSAGSTVYTTLEFFQWCASTFAESTQMDDDYAFVSDTPNVYRWVNSWDMGNETSYEFLSGGSVETADGQDLFSNVYSIGTQTADTSIYIIQNDTEVTSFWDTGNIDILLKVKSAGTLIDSGNILVMARKWGDLYDHNNAGLSGGGSTPVGINTALDGNNDTAAATVSAYGITIGTWGTYSEDLNNGNGATDYDVKINCNGKTMKEVFEFLKYETRAESTTQINGDDGKEYLSADEGTYTDVKVAPFGTLAGTTFYGARGVWLDNYASADFVLINSAGDTQAPPDYQNVIASHTDLSGTNIFVSELTGSGGDLIKDYYTISSATNLSITLTSDVSANRTPQSGILRVGDTQYDYTSFTGAIFTITGDATGETGGLYVPMLDVLADATSEQSANVIYDGTPFYCRTDVRQYGYKPYTADVEFGGAGITFQPILTNDPQAS